jgi:hypothetical protein
MGNIAGFIKVSCNRCKKYGILTLTSLPPFRLNIKETHCPFCQSEIEKSTPTQLEIDTFINSIDSLALDAITTRTLTDALRYKMTDEEK